MTLRARLVLLCAIVLLAQAGCKKAVPDPTSAAPALANAGAPPTKLEAKQFADRMTKAVQARDPAAIDKLLRLPDLGGRAISDLGLSASQRQDFVRGMSRVKETGIGQMILKSVEGDGSYQLLRIRTVDGRPRLLFRLIGSSGALNYHEYALARYEDGEVATEDMFIFLAGEPLSQTMRRLLISGLAANRGMTGRGDPQELKGMENFIVMSKATRSGDFKSAIAAYRTLPKEYQERKPFLIQYLQATMNLDVEGEADYLAAMDKFRNLYPTDAALDLISIDYFFLKEQYGEARGAIDRLNKAVGGDPYLDVCRGTAWMEAGHFDEARRAIEKAIAEEPDLKNAYWHRIALSLREKNYADTLEWLKRIVEKCAVEIQDLTASPEYVDFAKSPQHGEWLKWHADWTKGDGRPERKEPPGPAVDD